MLHHFNEVSQMQSVMKLRFEEFLDLIEKRDLSVSYEDTVLETALKWVEYVPQESPNTDSVCSITSPMITVPVLAIGIDADITMDVTIALSNENNKEQLLHKLLKAVRLCLLRTPWLEYVMKHRLIINDGEAKNIVLNAVL